MVVAAAGEVRGARPAPPPGLPLCSDTGSATAAILGMARILTNEPALPDAAATVPPGASAAIELPFPRLALGPGGAFPRGRHGHGERAAGVGRGRLRGRLRPRRAWGHRSRARRRRVAARVVRPPRDGLFAVSRRELHNRLLLGELHGDVEQD